VEQTKAKWPEMKCLPWNEQTTRWVLMTHAYLRESAARWPKKFSRADKSGPKNQLYDEEN
jgi:hypothetical protein